MEFMKTNWKTANFIFLSAGSEDKPIGAIKFSESDSDQSEEGSDDTPSSIRKMKKRLLSKSTPTRPPSLTLPDLGMTPKARAQQSPNEVFLTGQLYRKHFPFNSEDMYFW